MFCQAVYWWAHLIGQDHHRGGTKKQAPIWLVEFIKIQKKSDFSPSKFQLVGDVIGCCRSLVRLSVIFTGIYVSVTFLSPICHRFVTFLSPFFTHECHHFIIQHQAMLSFPYGIHIALRNRLIEFWKNKKILPPRVLGALRAVEYAGKNRFS